MKLLANAIAVVLLVIGVVRTLQGANIVGGSFMTGQSRWRLYVGLVVVVVSLIALWWINLSGARGPVRRDSVADSPTATAATTSTGMRRPVVMRSSQNHGRGAS